MPGRLHEMMTRAEEALLARTLVGRRLEVDVVDASGAVIFPRGREIDREILDRARQEELLEELAHAAEPSTSDSELADLLWWRKQHREASEGEGGG